jgi:hypothetical protein
LLKTPKGRVVLDGMSAVSRNFCVLGSRLQKLRRVSKLAEGKIPPGKLSGK